MTQFFFPFTSIDGDRRYNARDFATYFHSIFTDGVIATVKDKLRVSESETTGMHVVVNTGAAFIHGHLYLLSEPLTVVVTPGNSTGDRVDSIVLQLDHLERDMKILYKRNSTSVQRDENYWELQLATIDVPRNATKVLNSQINDKRANESVAGYSKLQGNLDVEGMEQHYESLLQQLSADMTAWVSDKKVDFQGDWDAWFTTTQNTLEQLVTDMQGWTDDKQLEFQTGWDAWFATVQDALDGNTAGNLLNMITQLQTDLGNIDAPTTQEFEQLEADAAAHRAEKVHQGEIHGFRLTDGKLEYFDGAEWQRVKGGGYPVGAVTELGAKSDNASAIVTWRDPEDVTIKDSLDNIITIARWGGTKLLMKTTGYPENENDGTLVVDNGVRNQYREDGFELTGLTNDQTYYISTFPYTTEGVFGTKTDVLVTPTGQRIYGVRIDKNNSNPETRVTYIGDAVGFAPMRGNNGDLQWGGWEFILDEFEINPVVLKDSEVNYYLRREDRTKKADGSNAVLTGADGDVMVEFGTPVWYKWTDVGDAYTIEVSNKHFSGAVKHGFEVEEGYNQALYYPLLTTQVFFPILFKSTDSQSALGRGRVDGASGYANTGGTNTKGMFYGSNADEQMCFLGIEDYWGNKLWWIDGLATNANFDLLIGKGDFNDNGNGYEVHGSGVSANTVGYIDEAQGGNDKGFIIKSRSGSETTYYADYGHLLSSRVAAFGGGRWNGAAAGAFALLLYYSGSYSGASFGARLFCASDGKIYIGAYLGTVQGGKLRSVSGQEPTGSKTIGAFRTDARANN